MVDVLTFSTIFYSKNVLTVSTNTASPGKIHRNSNSRHQNLPIYSQTGLRIVRKISGEGSIAHKLPVISLRKPRCVLRELYQAEREGERRKGKGERRKGKGERGKGKGERGKGLSWTVLWIAQLGKVLTREKRLLWAVHRFGQLGRSDNALWLFHRFTQRLSSLYNH
jgi:hypothetical protein